MLQFFLLNVVRSHHSADLFEILQNLQARIHNTTHFRLQEKLVRVELVQSWLLITPNCYLIIEISTYCFPLVVEQNFAVSTLSVGSNTALECS
jgi:hypothetical protein